MGRGPTGGRGGIRLPDIAAFRKALDTNVRIDAFRKSFEERPQIQPINPEREVSIAALREKLKRFHGMKVPLFYFPGGMVNSKCADKFGYLTPSAVRTATKLPFNVGTQTVLGQLGAAMGAPAADAGADAALPAGFTYFGQFVDHDITLDTASKLDTATDATTIHNMRTPSLELDSVYGRGPALDAYLYNFPPAGEPPTAIRMQLGSNMQTGPGGPGGPAGAGGMAAQTDFDVPRVVNPLNTALSTNTAIIGDPRNDENLIVSQFHHAMLKFHNEVVDSLVAVSFGGDIFAEAKRLVTHHYQWAVVHDFLVRICGSAAVNDALANVNAPVGSGFSMPVEFAVGAYRFGHSLIRNRYWLSAAQINASLGDVFNFIRNPNIPVMSNWTVDMNAFFETGIPVAVFNRTRKIDTALAAGLSTLPGESGVMAQLATRNLRRGLALGLPSGQGVAGHFGIAALTPAQLTGGLAADQAAALNASGGLLLAKTPLWYYCLREAAVLEGGERLGPVGARIVAETFVRMLKRDANSFLNAAGGFTPFLPTLPTTPAGQFTVADLVHFAGVTMP